MEDTVVAFARVVAMRRNIISFVRWISYYYKYLGIKYRRRSCYKSWNLFSAHKLICPPPHECLPCLTPAEAPPSPPTHPNNAQKLYLNVEKTLIISSAENGYTGQQNTHRRSFWGNKTKRIQLGKVGGPQKNVRILQFRKFADLFFS